jgi:hypothetical protein
MTIYEALYAYVPERWQRPFWRLYFGLTPHLGLPIPMVRLRGPVRPHGRSGTIGVAGRAAWLRPYLTDTLFLSPPAVEEIGTTTLWLLPDRLRELRETADATFALLDTGNARWALGREHFRLPTWVDLQRPAPAEARELKRQSSSVQSDLRLLRREGLRACLSREPGDLDRFHADYYMPMIRKRHGDHAFLQSLPFSRAIYRTGFLVWIEKNGERVAGGLIGQRDGVLKIYESGLGRGDQGWARRGAHAAVYCFVFEQARQLGAHAIDFGGCRPLLSDGVLRYKRKWGGRLHGRLATSYEDLGLAWARFNPVVADVLAELSAIFLDRERLSALSCIDVDRPGTAADAERQRRMLWLPGLHRLYLTSPHGWQAQTAAPPGCVLLAPDAVQSSAGALLRCCG